MKGRFVCTFRQLLQSTSYLQGQHQVMEFELPGRLSGYTRDDTGPPGGPGTLNDAASCTSFATAHACSASKSAERDEDCKVPMRACLLWLMNLPGLFRRLACTLVPE